jgi:hypothetical protein
MKLGKSIVAWFFAAVLVLPSAAEAGSVAKAAARGATRSVTKAWRGAAAKTLRWDLLRDRATHVRLLSKDRAVFRYTTKAQARQEIRKGIRPGRHMTARATAGRPLSPALAQRRYGLPQQPEVRETIRLSKGQPVRLNKAIGGAAGMGEVSSTRRVPSAAVVRIVPLRRGR